MLKKLCFLLIGLLLCNKTHATPPPYPTSTSNQALVAEQLESLIPDSLDEAALVNAIYLLEVPETEKLLSQLTGVQYTSLFLSTEITNRQFIRRLYDPLRLIVSNPCSCEEEVYELCSSDGIVAWAEGSVNRSFLDGNKNAGGFKMSGYEISIGGHKRFTPCWTFGIGGCYAINHVHYNIGGSTKSNTVLGALYALYRPANYYVLGDVTLGYATNDMHRKVKFRDENFFLVKSRPNISQVSFYGEAGFDWNCNCILIQPFVGFETTRFMRSCKLDHGLPSLRLIYRNKQATNAYSRLGFHLTTPENCYDLTFAFDLAWQYRLTAARNNLTVRFDTFGAPFTLTGIPDERNSMSMAFAVWSEFMEGWTIYLEASGERWRRVSNYNFTGGLVFKW